MVHIRNALDHSFDPVLGIERMLHAVRPGGWVLLRHARNEGVAGKFRNGHLVLFPHALAFCLFWWNFCWSPAPNYLSCTRTALILYGPVLLLAVVKIPLLH